MKYCLLLFLLIFLSCQQKRNYPAGGFDYPGSIASKDSSFYIYQYKDSLSTLDSFNKAEFGRYFLGNFKEPNLSVHPQQETVFRLLYEDWMNPCTIINLTEKNITVKQAVAGWIYPNYNREKLTISHQKLLNLIEWYLKLDEEKKKDSMYIHFLDSLFHIYPHMDDINFYKNLLQQVAEYKPFTYSIKTIPITEKRFDTLLSLINQSGYWNMPRVSDCDNIPTDASRFTLEANTPQKYKIISSLNCADDDRKFTAACQAIITAAGLNNKINLIWEGKVIADTSGEILLKPYQQ